MRAAALMLAAGFALHAGTVPRARAEESPRPAFPRVEERRTRWPLLLAGTGVAAGIGLGAWLKSEADDRYARYLATADPATARRWFEDAERYDRLSLAGWVTAQASFIALFVLVTRDVERPMIPTEGEPLVRARGDGIEVGWRVAP